MLGLDHYSEEIAVGIKNTLKEDGRHFYFDDAAGFFSLYLEIDGEGIDRLHYLITVDEEAFLLYAIFPLKAECNNRRMMNTLSEFINRANYRLHKGNFQLNFQTGEIRIKIFHNCEGKAPSKSVVNDAILTAAAAFENYGNALLGIIYRRDMTAKEAFEDGVRKQIRRLFIRDDRGEDDTEEIFQSSETPNGAASEGGFDPVSFMNELKAALAEEAGGSVEGDDNLNTNLFEE